MMNVVWFVGGLVLMALGVVCSWGALLSKDHTVTRSVLVPADRGAVWAVVREPRRFAEWRPSVSRVEVVTEANGVPMSWVERSGKDGLRLAVEREDAGATLETRIDDASLPFGGSWTIELTDEAGQTRVRVTERGFVKPAPFRFIAKYIMGHEATMSKYLLDLSRKYGSAASVDL